MASQVAGQEIKASKDDWQTGEKTDEFHNFDEQHSNEHITKYSICESF